MSGSSNHCPLGDGGSIFYTFTAAKTVLFIVLRVAHGVALLPTSESTRGNHEADHSSGDE